MATPAAPPAADAPPAPPAAVQALPGRPPLAGWRQGSSYGALGLPLAFVALPLYVVLPNHYATTYGVPLAALGLLLLGTRLFDAVTDPWIGRWVDRWFAHSHARVLRAAALAAAATALGFHGLFFPPVQGLGALLLWCGALLVWTYVAYSVLLVLHHAWGARLGGDAGQRAQVVAWREGYTLAGVLLASVLPALAGIGAASAVFAATLAAGIGLLGFAPRSAALPPVAAAAAPRLPLTLPLQDAAFRRLLAVFLVNGIAAAVPATLVLFFIRDRLEAPAWEPLFLFCYFAAAALSMPLWVRAVPRLGLARAWLLGMLLAVATFVWAATLGAGDIAAFVIVCLASGFALGADLALPGALLAGVIQRAGRSGRAEGAYFGWWGFTAKLNLALAAGLALPALQLLGYSPGSRDPDALLALTLAYCVLPCLLKLAAAALLYRLWLRHPGGSKA